MSENEDPGIKKIINCSFCNKTRQQVEQMVEGPEFGGKNLYICNECVDVTHEILHKEEPEKVKKKRRAVIPSPEQIKTHLDEYIIGQDSAKIAIAVAVYNHFKRIHTTSKTEIEKSNLLMIGESGCGKTLTVKTIAKLFDLPYVIADATTLTEAGYVGEDVENLVKRLLHNAEDDLEKAQHGIIFIDEIDKKSRRSESATVSRDVSGEGVQQALLKLVEGTVIRIDDRYDDDVDFDTKDVLFICSGAFVGLDEVIEPYNTTLNTMPTDEIKTWSEKVLAKLKEKIDLDEDKIIFLAGENYRKYLIPHIRNYAIPLKGLGIGKQLKFLKEHSGEGHGQPGKNYGQRKLL